MTDIQSRREKERRNKKKRRRKKKGRSCRLVAEENGWGFSRTGDRANGLDAGWMNGISGKCFREVKVRWGCYTLSVEARAVVGRPAEQKLQDVVWM